MTPRELEEYRALRATIRERGTTRVWLFVLGLTLWAALTLATAAVTSTMPLATLLPLLVLAALFEALFALHTGVERIGRYLQVFYEGDDETRQWEHVAMSFGANTHLRLPDPLFPSIFLIATLGNFVPALLGGPLPIEVTIVGALHIVFGLRIVLAQRLSRRQRAADLARFTDVMNTAQAKPGDGASLT